MECIFHIGANRALVQNIWEEINNLRYTKFPTSRKLILEEMRYAMMEGDYMQLSTYIWQFQSIKFPYKMLRSERLKIFMYKKGTAVCYRKIEDILLKGL